MAHISTGKTCPLRPHISASRGPSRGHTWARTRSPDGQLCPGPAALRAGGEPETTPRHARGCVNFVEHLGHGTVHVPTDGQAFPRVMTEINPPDTARAENSELPGTGRCDPVSIFKRCRRKSRTQKGPERCAQNVIRGKGGFGGGWMKGQYVHLPLQFAPSTSTGWLSGACKHLVTGG